MHVLCLVVVCATVCMRVYIMPVYLCACVCLSVCLWNQLKVLAATMFGQMTSASNNNSNKSKHNNNKHSNNKSNNNNIQNSSSNSLCTRSTLRMRNPLGTGSCI